MINWLRIQINNLAPYRMLYDVLMALLAIGIVITLIIDSQPKVSIKTVDLTIYFDHFVWFIFTVDYLIRLLIAKDRFSFIRHNIVDLIAILPFELLFQGVRALRLVRLLLMLRAFAYLNRAYKRIGFVLKTNNFDHVLWFTFCTIFIGAMSISFVDDMNIGDAFWWSFVTTTTVGYGDIAPTSIGGRIIAVFLMIVGIGFLSTLTGTISTYLINNINNRHKPEHLSLKEKEINSIISSLKDFDHMSVKDIDDMHSILLSLKEKSS